MNKYCTKCGNVVNENDNFCGYCRNSLNNNIEQMNNQNMINNGVNSVNQDMNQTQSINNSQNINTVKTNGLAITGFIMSIASPTFCCGLLSLSSLIVSIIGLIKVNKTKENGKGLAIAGIIISAVTILAYILYIILLIANLIDTPSYIPSGIDV